MIIDGTEIFEKDCSYPEWVDISLFNENGILKPSAFQKLFATCVERHLSKFHAATDDLLVHNLAWVLTSASFKIVRPITECQTLFMQTWHSQHKGPYFRRDFIFRDENGEEYFRGANYSILLDMTSRKIFRKRAIPFELDAPYETTVLEASPNFKTDVLFSDISERRVFPSQLDRLGHVNNVCYGDFAYDTLSEKEIQRLAELKRIDVYFLSEMRKGDQFTLQRADDENRIIIRGKNNTKDDIAFCYILTF